jgi:hypothetical protein
MAEPAHSFEQPHERVARLHELGLDEKTIETAVLRGFVARQTCTSFDPPSYPGTVQWAQTHRAMRELTAPLDWTPDDTRNFSRVVSPNRAVAATVATGDEHTGVRGATEPRTKYPKGSETTLAVETNVHLEQLSLWPSPTARTQDTVEAKQQVLWMLLIATGEHEVRYELSRPKGQDEQGRVVSWSERIIFGPLDIDSIPTKNDDGNEDDDGDEGLDVPVERI